MQELKREGKLTLRLRLYFNTGPRVDGKPGNPEAVVRCSTTSGRTSATTW